MKLFETSMLELPITLLRKVLPYVDNYYQRYSRHLDAYEHLWTGAILWLVLANHPVALGVGAFLHIFAKEIIYDVWYLKKRLNTVDLFLRIVGFPFGYLLGLI